MLFFGSQDQELSLYNYDLLPFEEAAVPPSTLIGLI
jgi:hypothetical protein